MPQKAITKYYASKKSAHTGLIEKKKLLGVDNTVESSKSNEKCDEKNGFEVEVVTRSEESKLDQIHTAFSSPKRILSPADDGIISRKRRKKGTPSDFHTKKELPIVIHGISKTARKKLCLNKETVDLKTIHKSDEIKNTETSAGTSSPNVKLTALEIKEKLKKCGKLSELQERLSSMNECSKQLKKLRTLHPYSPKKALLSPQSSPGKISPLGSPRKLSRYSPVKRQLCFKKIAEEPDEQPSIRTPAYQRFHNLSQPATDTLVLPFGFKILAEAFRCVDTVVSLLHNRHEMCTFTKIKKAVEEMMRKAFTLTRLGQIKSVFPVAYFFKQEKIDKNKQNSHDLTVIPNLDTPEHIATVTEDYAEELINDKVFKNIDDEPSNQKSGQMNPSTLLFRRQIFHFNLIEVVRRHHEKYLTSLNPPIYIPRDKLTTWHPSFKIDLLPNVPSAQLPLPPTIKVYTSAKDVLDKALSISGSGTKVEKALKKIALKQEEDCNVIEACKNDEKPKTENLLLKGIPESLLKKIRAKEAAKAALQMTKDPEDDKNKRMLEHFPDFIRIIRTYFVAEKKVAIPIDDVIKKLAESYRSSLDSADIENHLKKLCSLLPTWIMILKLQKGVFVKIDKNKNLAVLYEQVNKQK